MKYLSKILIVVSILYSSISAAQNQQYEILNKAFEPVSNSTVVKFTNNFGNISLAVWEKNSIVVKITLDVEGFNEKESKEIMNKIDLDVSENSSAISIKTKLDSHESFSFRKKNFKINYEIKMPDGHPLILNNEFGNIFLTDYSGKTTINLEYGNLTAGSLKELNLSHEFGKGEIESITEGKIEMEYIDGFNLTEANQLDLTAEFSKIDIQNINTINFDIEYGKLVIGSVSHYDGSSEFSEIVVNELYETFRLDAEYASGTIEIGHVSKDIKSFQLSTEFSKSEIKIEQGANLQFATEHSFGKLKTEGESFVFSKKINDMSEEKYEGTIGSQQNSTNTILKVKTNYGSCTIIAD